MTLATYMVVSGFGTVQAWLIFKTIGITGVCSLVVFHSYFETHTFVFAAIFILSTGFRNSVGHLREAMVMDNTPENSLGLVKSLDSINGMAYGLTAVVGGSLIDKYGYIFTLSISSFGQYLGVLEGLVLVPLIVQDKMKSTIKSDETDHAENTENFEKRMGETHDSMENAEDGVEDLKVFKISKTPITLSRRASTIMRKSIALTVDGVNDLSTNKDREPIFRSSFRRGKSFRVS